MKRSDLRSAIIHAYLAGDILGHEMDYLLSRIGIRSDKEVLELFDAYCEIGLKAKGAI